MIGAFRWRFRSLLGSVSVIAFATKLFAVNLEAMPTYEFNIPLDSIPSGDDGGKVCEISAVTRFYDNYGDGSQEGWKETLPTPIFEIDGQPMISNWNFNYDTQFDTGPIYLGYDMYAQYLYTTPNGTFYPNSIFTVQGTFLQVAYMSITLMATVCVGENRTSAQVTIMDFEGVSSNGKNPYTIGAPSVMSYTPAKHDDSEISAASNKTLLNGKFMTDPVASDGSVPVFRLDRRRSLSSVADDIAPDGCSRGYLFAFKAPNQEILILRMKLPTTFFDTYQPDTIFGDYQARYFSVSSNHYYAEGFPTYYTVNSRNLAPYQDPDGYIYVFFAPNSYSLDLAKQQNISSPTVAPVMTWGNFTGLVLGDPDFAMLLRYRIPNPSWIGNPENAECYDTNMSQPPLSKNELGEYTPEIYGDTMENFMLGRIGAVTSTGPWPV